MLLRSCWRRRVRKNRWISRNCALDWRSSLLSLVLPNRNVPRFLCSGGGRAHHFRISTSALERLAAFWTGTSASAARTGLSNRTESFRPTLRSSFWLLFGRSNFCYTKYGLLCIPTVTGFSVQIQRRHTNFLLTSLCCDSHCPPDWSLTFNAAPKLRRRFVGIPCEVWADLFALMCVREQYTLIPPIRLCAGAYVPHAPPRKISIAERRSESCIFLLSHQKDAEQRKDIFILPFAATIVYFSSDLSSPSLLLLKKLLHYFQHFYCFCQRTARFLPPTSFSIFPKENIVRYLYCT